jgi:hypothetical protein
MHPTIHPVTYVTPALVPFKEVDFLLYASVDVIIVFNDVLHVYAFWQSAGFPCFTDLFERCAMLGHGVFPMAVIM